MGHDSIAIVDFGGMFAHLFATKVRRLKVLAEIRQPDDPVEAFQGFKGVILVGGPGESQGFDKAIFGLDVPILGCGFGHLEMARFYGGSVGPSPLSWGHSDLKIVADHPLVDGFVGPVWSSQQDVVTSVGPEFAKLAATVCK
ncbi:MAG TPA: glutamine-hydrolyzing GMP synthase, partial [Oligoflexales bacterium]|nr:glutamine-hydrolyzing GMP synthase [Oligoflexales bacterium]